MSRGASMIEYWHWHTLHFGAETFWGGVLPHSLEPGRTYRQIKELGADFAAAGYLVTGLTPDADIALVYSNDTKWAFQEAPQLSLAGQHDSEPDPRSYQAIFDAFYRGAFDAGLQSRLLHPGQMIAQDPAAYASAQPVLVAAGFKGAGFSPSPAAAGTRWIDGVQPQGAQVLASYDHVHFGRWPALTTNAHGKGRITYVGTVPNEALARDILQWAARDQGDWRPQTASQTVTGASARDGRRLRFVHNWSWTPGSFKLPGAVTDVISGESLGYGDVLELGAWDVRVLVEADA